jgi:hypothetical protein
MGIVATFSRIQPDQFEQMKAEKKYPREFETESLYIDKSWDVISFILLGKVGPKAGEVLSEIMNPEENFVIYQDEYMTESLPYSSPEKVKEINEALQLITESGFRELINKRDFSNQPIYPEIWDPIDDQVEYIVSNFMGIKAIFEKAAKNNDYVATIIGY